MAEEKKPSAAALDAKWDACLDLGIRRVVYSSFAGALGGLLLFRSPTTRWASVAFGAGLGIGAAYTECSYIFDGSFSKWSAPQVSTVPSVPSQGRKEHVRYGLQKEKRGKIWNNPKSLEYKNEDDDKPSVPR